MQCHIFPSFAAAVIVTLLAALPLAAQSPIQVYGAWHCYTDGCSWASAPNMTTFDTDNRWLIDRNMNGTYAPSVNLVVLSFVQPVKLMNLTTDSGDTKGIPVGMNSAVINYFQSKGVRVMLSIGGASYKKDWDKALSSNPMQLGINAANAAKALNVGIEIDYESSSPNLTGLQSFVTAYRSVVPYDPTGQNYAARLTIDLGDGDTYLTPLANYAVTNWLKTSAPVLDYANAMVGSQKTSVSALEAGWQQHVDGDGTAVPPRRRLSSPEVCGLSAAKPIATISVTPIRTRPRVLWRISLRTGREQPQGCWAICSGQLDVRATAQAALSHLILARREWEERPLLSTFRFQCRHCASNNGL